MEDLDSLLEDLGRGKSTSTVKKQRPPSSRVDLNELENLMEDLAAPTPKQIPEVVSASNFSGSVNSTFTPPKSMTPTSSSSNLNSNSSSNSSNPQFSTSRPTSSVVVNNHINDSPPQQHQHQQQSVSSPTPSNKSNPPSANIDDLDALMESLNASSSRSQRRSVMPSSGSSGSLNAPQSPQPQQQQPTNNTTVQPTIAPKQTVSAVYTPPQTNNTSSSSSFQQTTPVKTQPTTNNVYTPPPVQQQPPKTNTTPSYQNPPPKKSDDLDSLLQNLTSQMNNIDHDNPSSRGICWTCKGNILGEIIQALGKSFHPEHFTCGNCRSPLGTKSFYEHNGSPHCENCYQELFCPKCAHCDGPVLDRCITALGKKWHVDHFICTQCLKPFQGGNFFERDGRPYCEADFYGLYAPKCGHCNEAIRGDCINALGSQWHPEHFVCAYCEKSFAGGSFFEYGGKPYCETHYHQQTGSLCSGCGKPITGRCVNALDKKWHPEHFVCAFCMNPLAGGSFTEHNSKAYCKECHGKLFGG